MFGNVPEEERGKGLFFFLSQITTVFMSERLEHGSNGQNVQKYIRAVGHGAKEA